MIMEFEGNKIITALLQLFLSLIFFLQALIKLITSKLQRCCKCPCPCHRELEEELDRERSASATAAEQSLAMISRLQKEKASLEMNARQYRRTAEQRQLYDLQAITFLKELVLKLERENYTVPQQHISVTFPPHGRIEDEEQKPLPNVLLHRSATHHGLSSRLFE